MKIFFPEKDKMCGPGFEGEFSRKPLTRLTPKDKKKIGGLAVSTFEIASIPSNVPQNMTVCQWILWDDPGQQKTRKNLFLAGFLDVLRCPWIVIWSHLTESNRWPALYESAALPSELKWRLNLPDASFEMTVNMPFSCTIPFTPE
jgi:hypothetical protein